MKRLIKIELICLAINPAENFEYNVIVDEKNRFPTLDLGKGTIRESLDKLMREYVNTTTDWVKPSALNVSDGDGHIKISFSAMVPYDFVPSKGSWSNLRMVLGSFQETEDLLAAIRKSKYELY